MFREFVELGLIGSQSAFSQRGVKSIDEEEKPKPKARRNPPFRRGGLRDKINLGYFKKIFVAIRLFAEGG